MQFEVPCVIMYLSVHDSDRKRAFTLAGRHSLKGGTMQVQLKKGGYGYVGASIINTAGSLWNYEIVSTISEIHRNF